LAVARLTHIAVTRFELEADVCGVAMPVFGSGGELMASIELTLRDPDVVHSTLLAPLTIAARSLTRELATRHSWADRSGTRCRADVVAEVGF
jgi:DNA-binding IclR family transcriptional regulator